MSQSQTQTIAATETRPAALSFKFEDQGKTLLKGPIKNSGAFDTKWGKSASFHELTPVIGRVYEPSLQLQDILAENDEQVLRDLALLITNRGVVVFKDQKLKPEEQQDFILKLHHAAGAPRSAGLHIHPSAVNTSDTGVNIQRISSKAQMAAGGDFWPADHRKYIASISWHSDVSWEPAPADYSALKLVELPDSGGDTLFASGENLYNRLSPPFAAFLETLSAVHSGEVFIEEAARNGTKLLEGIRGSPLNKDLDLVATHPVIRTNPVNGRRSVFVNRNFTRKIVGVTPHESDAILKFLFDLQVHSHDLQARVRWEKNDLAVWDNRSNQHSATFDFGDQPRSGDRACAVGERPFFDPLYGTQQ